MKTISSFVPYQNEAKSDWGCSTAAVAAQPTKYKLNLDAHVILQTQLCELKIF